MIRRFPFATFVALCLAFGQSAPPFRFDALSVKPSAPPPSTELSQGAGGKSVAVAYQPPGRMRRGGPGTSDPGRLYYPDATLKNLLVEAYGLPRFRIQGPDWLDEERFDIDAVMPPETTAAQFRQMLENLMIDRFQMSMHRETQVVPGYALVVDSRGPKLRKSPEISTPAAASPAQPEHALRRGPDGFPIFQGKLGPDGFPPSLPPFPVNLNGVPGFHAPYGWRLYFLHKTMYDLVDYLRVSLHCPVIDATSLSSAYDFTLTYMLNGTEAPSDSVYRAAPDLFTALRSQVGLKLNSRKLPDETIVIDHIEKVPTKN